MRSEGEEDKFWSRVAKLDGGCWLWTGGKTIAKYGILTVDSKRVLAHRIVFTFLGNPLPSSVFIDHKCHNPSCVNPDHLRRCTQRENSRNRGAGKNNTSGFKGVYWDKRKRLWIAEITVNRKKIYLGSSKRPEEAHSIYWEAAQKFHGEFANPG